VQKDDLDDRYSGVALISEAGAARSCVRRCTLARTTRTHRAPPRASDMNRAALHRMG
jgi:hypothetical protein